MYDEVREISKGQTLRVLCATIRSLNFKFKYEAIGRF